MDELETQQTVDAWLAGLTAALLDFGNNVGHQRLIPALNEEASDLVNTNPFAFALAACLDRGIKAEIAWTFPYWIKEQLGHLDPGLIAQMSLEEIDKLLVALPRKPRYRNDAARTVRDIAVLVQRETNGDASGLWKGRTSAEVERRFRSVHGVGPGIASMVVLLLERVFGLNFSDLDHRSMNVKPDVHVTRVLSRLGVMQDGLAIDPVGDPECRKDGSTEAALAIQVTRRMNPGYPARLDTPLWIIGRNGVMPNHQPVMHARLTACA